MKKYIIYSLLILIFAATISLTYLKGRADGLVMGHMTGGVERTCLQVLHDKAQIEEAISFLEDEIYRKVELVESMENNFLNTLSWFNSYDYAEWKEALYADIADYHKAHPNSIRIGGESKKGTELQESTRIALHESS